MSWEFYFVLACLPWDQGCARSVVLTYGHCAIIAAIQIMHHIFKLSCVLLAFVVLRVYHTTCLIALKFFGFWLSFCFVQSISSSWLALCPLKFRGLHWRQVSGLVVMVAVLDLLVSNKLFCLPKSGLTHIYMFSLQPYC